MAGDRKEETKQSNNEKRKIKLERQREARTIRKIVASISLAIIIVLAVGAISGYLYIASALKPADPDNEKKIAVEIPIGSTTASIGRLLEDNGVIKNATVFKYYIKFNNYSGFQAGKYTFTPAMKLDEIAETLQTGKLVREELFKITVPEGLQLDEIAAVIAKNTSYKKEDIVKKMDDPAYIQQLMKKYPELLTKDLLAKDIKHPLEGYLFPATYPFYEKNPPLDDIIETMIRQTGTVIEEYRAPMKEKKQTVHQLLTMSSLVEKEATAKADRHLISSVFYNRIAADMPLQTDPTVLYALGKHKDRTLYKDLEVDSPYNTYKVKGLPPGPISNAGKSSIEAALNPEKSEFKYFLAEHGNGEVHFSKTLDEHNAKKEKYITNKRK